MSSTRPNRLLLASIHDVSPRFEGEVDRLIDLLAPHVGTRLAMLVVPNHWGDAPIVPGSVFASRLRSWAEQGIEMFLHGFTHRDEAEYSGAAAALRHAPLQVLRIGVHPPDVRHPALVGSIGKTFTAARRNRRAARYRDLLD